MIDGHKIQEIVSSVPFKPARQKNEISQINILYGIANKLYSTSPMDQIRLASHIFDLLRANPIIEFLDADFTKMKPLEYGRIEIDHVGGNFTGIAKGGLLFHVNGKYYKGEIKIYLMDGDTYLIFAQDEIIKDIQKEYLIATLKYFVGGDPDEGKNNIY